MRIVQMVIGAGLVVALYGITPVRAELPGCGPEAVAAALTWSGISIDAQELEGSPHREVPRRLLLDAAHSQARIAYPITKGAAVAEEVKAGYPVILLRSIQVENDEVTEKPSLNGPAWSCNVATDYSQEEDTLVLHTDAGEDTSLPLGELTEEWENVGGLGFVILLPGELPTTVSKREYLRAVHDLDNAGHHWEAVTAYDTALAEWPDDPEALIGLGLSLFALRDTVGATAAFQSAQRLNAVQGIKAATAVNVTP